MNKRILTGIAIVGLIGMMVFLVFWLQDRGKGALEITTSEPKATINLYDSATHQAKKIGTGSATARLKPGYYTVEATLGGLATRAVGQIEAGQTTELNLPFTSLVQPKAMTNYSARDLFPTPDGVSFLNVPEKTVYHFAGSGEARPTNRDAYPASKVTWLANGTYVFVTPDQFYHYVAGSSISSISFTDAAGTAIIPSVVTITPTAQMAYVSGSNLFYRDSLTGPSRLVKKDVNIEFGAPSLAISANGILVASYDIAGAGVDSSKPTTPPTSFAVDVKSGAPVTLNLPDKHIEQTRWSPDGNLLAYTNQDGAFILNTKTNETTPILTLGGSVTRSFSWYDNKTAVYIQGQDTWKYDLTAGTSLKLFANPGSADLNSPFVPTTGGVEFATAAGGTFGSVGIIYKAPLK